MKRLWDIDAPLTVAGLLMLAGLVVALPGLWLDPRTLVGAPAWLKPAKFAMSLAIYSFTLIWVFFYLPEWRRTRRIIGWITLFVAVVELGVIDLQVVRGTTSHFNVSTPLDAALFGVMGTTIAFQTLTVIALVVALWRQRFTDRAAGWALRLGMSITLLGGMTGALMTQPTAAQLADARAGHRVTVVGAHTVGAPDGEAGMPGIHWSSEHGDLRVPHFVGLHAIQVLLLGALALKSLDVSEARRAHLVIIGAFSYAALFALLLWQALRGQSLIRPDVLTNFAFASWAILTAATLAITAAHARHEAVAR
jgi:hypothetical protein